MIPQISQDNFMQKDGRLWMTADDLGQKLGFTDGGKGISKLYSRNKEDFEPFKGVVNVTTAGGRQDFLCFDEQGCYIAAMLARTDQAKQFRRALARFLASMRTQSAEIAERYAVMKTETAKMELFKFAEYHNLRKRDIDRIRALRPHLSATELARLFDLTVSVMEKLLGKIRRADGDFTNRTPKNLLRLKGGNNDNG